MQKRVTRELRMAGDEIMKMAEELYQGGFISYPRTETDGFSKDYDLKVCHIFCCSSSEGWPAYQLSQHRHGVVYAASVLIARLAQYVPLQGCMMTIQFCHYLARVGI